MDEMIKQDIIDQLARDGRVDASRVTIAVSDGTVTLGGEVPTYFARTAAFEDARSTLGVVNVLNQLWVRFPSTFKIPADREIENSITEKIGANPDIDPIDFVVTVDAGRVTLRGTVDAYWKKLHAEQLAAWEPGVSSIENHMAVVPSEDILDKSIASDITSLIEIRTLLDAEKVQVEVEKSLVTIEGTAPNWSARRDAEEAAGLIYGVTDVINHIIVTGL